MVTMITLECLKVLFNCLFRKETFNKNLNESIEFQNDRVCMIFFNVLGAIAGSASIYVFIDRFIEVGSPIMIFEFVIALVWGSVELLVRNTK